MPLSSSADTKGLGSTSFTSSVPTSVPSVFHSSSPARKNKVFPMFSIAKADDDSSPGSMSFTSDVPAAVPSLFHSSAPLRRRTAVKKSVPSTLRLER